MRAKTMTRAVPQTDVDRVARAADGDRAAREAIVAEHGPTLWSVCRRLDPDPEDAYQEVWLMALRSLERFDPAGPASLRTYLVSIAHRHLVDRHRRRTVRDRVVPLDTAAEPPLPPEELLDRARRTARLETALRRLPEPQRRVVVLHHLHARELETIARDEGVAVGTVKSRLHRGRARLADLLRGGR